MSTTKPKAVAIKAVKNFPSLPDGDLVARTNAVIKGMTGNAAFPNSPVDLTVLQTTVTTYTAAIATALDGGKTAKELRNKERKLVIKDLRLLAVYVENACNDDASIFATSGFEEAPTVRTPATGIPAIPAIRKLDFGSGSGQFLVYIAAVTGARSYNLRYAVVTNGAPGTWTVMPVGVVRKPVTVSGLTAGATYAFQVQALGSEGLSEWSDSTTSMSL